MINTITLFASTGSQNLTSLDIIDTAVKIGLGAIISGIATYLVTRLQQKGDIEKELRKRKVGIIQEVAEQIEEINHVYLKYAALTISSISRILNGVEISETLHEDRIQVMTELFNSFKNLSNAEAKMMLIGEFHTAELIRNYGDRIANFRAVAVVKEPYPMITEIEELKNDILDSRKVIFTALSNIYKLI